MAQGPLPPRRPLPGTLNRIAGGRAAGGVRIARPVRPSKPSAFPLLPALAAAFILLGGAQLAFWWWESRLPGPQNNSTTASGSNPFLAFIRAPEPEAGRVRQAWRLSAPPLAQNIQFGDAMARVTVTIFTDPSCGRCRAQVQRWTAGLPVQGVRQVYKFWPVDFNRSTPGLLVELARRQGVVGDFWKAVQGAGDADLNDETLLTMLERAGVPLADQRAALTNDGAELMTALEPDIKLGRDERLPGAPVVMVDDYVLDGAVLSPERLGVYVKKRLEGRQIFEKGELFLMQK